MREAAKAGVTETTAVVVSALVILVITIASFAPISAVARTSVVTYTRYTAYPRYPVSTYTSVVTNTFRSSGSQQVYSLNDYTLNCSSSVYQSATLNQGWNIRISYFATDTITVFLSNSTGFTIWKSGNSPSPVANESGLANGLIEYTVPMTDTYYLVWYNNLHDGFIGCLTVGEKVTIISTTGIASYTVTMTVVSTATAYSTSISFNTSTYASSSTTTSTKSVGWFCYLIGC